MPIALVTGASGEIGKAIALSLANNGFDIIAHYNRGDVSVLIEEIEKKGQKCFPFQADLSNIEDICRLSAFAEELGGITALVNNAGISVVDVFQYVDTEKISKLYDINLRAAVELTRKVIPSMISKKEGKIVNVSSIWGVYGASCEVDYSTSKAALIGFTKALAKEVGLSNINVNCVAPGFVNTKMNDHLSEEEKEEFIQDTILCRAVEPSEVGDVVSFLCSKSSSAVSGECIVIGG